MVLGSKYLCCNRQSNVNFSKRFCGIFTAILTLITTALMLFCVCTDYWDDIQYNVMGIANDPTMLKSPCTNVTNLSSNGLMVKTYAIDLLTGTCSKDYIGNVILAETGGIWRNCWHMSDSDKELVIQECGELVFHKCLYYLDDVSSFCCKQCQYTVQEFDELDDNGETTYGTHYSTISFVIVAVILHSVCYLLIAVVIYRRIVPVVMMTGIIFVLSAAFLTFALAANAYKISAMNSKLWILPHVSMLMAKYRQVHEGWSMTIGWCAVIFSCFTSVTWIKLSYRLAAASNKIIPGIAPLVQQPTIVVDIEPMANGINNTAGRVVQWAKRRASNSNSRKSIPNGTTSGNLMEGHF